jgi:hypothetical protein
MTRRPRPVLAVRAAMAAFLATGLVMAGGASARATVYEQFRFGPDTQTFTEDDDCGFTTGHVVVTSGLVRTRTGEGDLDTAFFGLFNSQSVETVTNLANGRFLTIDSHSVINDVKATHIDGSIFQFVTLQAGQPFVLRDADGNVVLRDRGAIRSTYLFDTGGDAVPGGEVIQTLDVRVAGPHPGFFLDDAAFCATVHSLIG